MSLIERSQTVHAQLNEIEELYAAFQEQTRAPEFSEFAQESYNKAKQALERDAVRLDCQLQGIPYTDSDTETETPNIPNSEERLRTLRMFAIIDSLPSPISTISLVLLLDCDVNEMTEYDKNLITVASFVINNIGKDGFPPSLSILEFHELFLMACENGHANIVKELLARSYQYPFADYFAFIAACRKGHAKVVQLLLTDPRVNPAANDNEAIRDASSRGHTKVVRLLLADKRVNPSANDNLAIRHASRNGHTVIVRMLLADTTGRVDPSAEQNEAIRYACYCGRAEIVQLLLQDPRVNPAANDNEAIRDASEQGHIEVVRLLLNWSPRTANTAIRRVDPSANDNGAIRGACAHAVQWSLNHREVVQLLLADPRVNPAANDNEAIRVASGNGNIELVKILLTDPRVVSCGLISATTVAAMNGYINIVQLLKQHMRPLNRFLYYIQPKPFPRSSHR